MVHGAARVPPPLHPAPPHPLCRHAPSAPCWRVVRPQIAHGESVGAMQQRCAVLPAPPLPPRVCMQVGTRKRRQARLRQLRRHPTHAPSRALPNERLACPQAQAPLRRRRRRRRPTCQTPRRAPVSVPRSPIWGRVSVHGGGTGGGIGTGSSRHQQCTPIQSSDVAWRAAPGQAGGGACRTGRSSGGGRRRAQGAPEAARALRLGPCTNRPATARVPGHAWATASAQAQRGAARPPHRTHADAHGSSSSRPVRWVALTA